MNYIHKVVGRELLLTHNQESSEEEEEEERKMAKSHLTIYKIEYQHNTYLLSWKHVHVVKVCLLMYMYICTC